jgi:hypothetical protein
MPPHGGHGHHGGGRGRGIPPFYYGGYGGPWYDPAVEIFTVDQGPCPDTRQPVVGSDGQVYQNACKARLAGVKPVKSAMQGLGDAAAPAPVDPTTYQVNIAMTSPYVSTRMIGPGGVATDITQPTELAFASGAAAGVALVGVAFLAGSLLKSILG